MIVDEECKDQGSLQMKGIRIRVIVDDGYKDDSSIFNFHEWFCT